MNRYLGEDPQWRLRNDPLLGKEIQCLLHDVILIFLLSQTSLFRSITDSSLNFFVILLHNILFICCSY